MLLRNRVRAADVFHAPRYHLYVDEYMPTRGWGFDNGLKLSDSRGHLRIRLEQTEG
jgi:hypothetical protein